MQIRIWLGSIAIVSALGCGGKASDEDVDRVTAATDDVTTDDVTTDDVTTDDVTTDDSPVTPTPPSEHRAVAEECDNERPPGNVSEFYEGEACTTDEECTDGPNGRCVDRRGPSCTYDECFADSDCTKGGPCGCEQGFWSDYNTCLAGNCQVDADCGEGGFCSPSFGSCGSYSGVVAYWCRTPQDTCVEDSECIDPEKGAGYCALYPEVGYWACQYGQCVG